MLNAGDNRGPGSVAIIGTRGYPSFYGGFETAVRKLAPFLCDAGYDVTVYGRSGAVALTDPRRDYRVHTIVTAGRDSRRLSALSYGLTATLHALLHPPDAALVMNVANGFFLPLLRARGVPCVVNVDGLEWKRAKWGPVARSIFYVGAILTAAVATELVYDSETIASYWNTRMHRSGVFIPYGADAIGPLPIEPGLAHRGYVLMVARLVPENSIMQFLAAAAVISQKHKVVIVGSAGYGGHVEGAVRDATRANPDIIWLGQISDEERLLSLWQHAGAYFHGHSVGGTNPALVQAMACGAPIVARDTPYNREVLGEAGLYVDPEPGDICERVLSLMDSPELQQSLSSAGEERAANRYTWEAVCSAYRTTLDQVYATRQARRSSSRRG